MRQIAASARDQREALALRNSSTGEQREAAIAREMRNAMADIWRQLLSMPGAKFGRGITPESLSGESLAQQRRRIEEALSREVYNPTRIAALEEALRALDEIAALSAEQLAALHEELARLAKEAEAAAEAERNRRAAEQEGRMRQQNDFVFDVQRRGKVLGGADERTLLEFDLARKAEKELQAASDLLKAGVITQEMFDELNRILGEETVQA